ncbi:hypothetical protein PHLGIDRAFT_262771 [Phlebiopsis gigantea 11061_1 CR5-6]|uniref:DNA-binding protein RAP1 n=1 Tax=Phlebiopsis gigantea (strain 11061_1 CR5-6) TaxID=745531 RepID=A0A0C3S7R7_PHLG1|nr:hypothetical protein PHLGIDRAFT_262771 [Phlebiopsis gigantea 11061_1 CR5-6]
MPIFQDEQGLAIKFFIQKDIPHDIQAEVCETIAAHGGRVESKVPRAGFILVQPGTHEEERLRLCWNSPDRPERYFVPYTFVEACKVQGILLKQIFLHEGKPIRMHIDSSIANVNVRAALSQRIVNSGGDPTASAQSARVILADPNTEVFQHLVKTYQNETEKYVESYLWVKKCIEKGSVTYTPVVYKNPGGRRAGEERTHFTEEDETHLCNWIAAKIPFKETGGRTGNRLYQQLCDMASDPDYAWVTRHTWQSWRERYKKNAARLDIKISEIVERNKPSLGEKGQYGYVRKPEEKAKRVKRKSREEETGPSTEEMEFISQPTATPPMPGPMTASPSLPPPGAFPHIMYDPRLGPPPFAPPPPPPTHIPPPEVVAARQTAAEEEDDESEWRIREGLGAQPQWARRAEEEEEPPKKKIKTIAEDGSLHVVDRAVMEVAQESRFTVEEVKEYYDKCGDMDRTRNRFRKMRAILAQLPDDEQTVPLAVAPNVMGTPFTPATAAAVNAIVEAANRQVACAPQAQLNSPAQLGSVVATASQ